MVSSWFIEIWREKLELLCNGCFNNSSTFSSISDKKFLSPSSPNCLYGNPDSSSDDESDVRSNTSGFPLAALLIFRGEHSVGQNCTISSHNFWLSSTKPMASFISAGLPILQLLRMHKLPRACLRPKNLQFGKSTCLVPFAISLRPANGTFAQRKIHNFNSKIPRVFNV